MAAVRKPLAPRPRTSSTGAERLIIGLALVVPLALILAVLRPWPTTGVGQSQATEDAQRASVLARRPSTTSAEPPPTLVPPTLTPAAIAVQTSAGAEPTSLPRGSYTVRSGDELKQIAAQYGVSIRAIIDANDIPNPDSLRVGQVLRIPEP
jgi:nucleoid-associated protein YgaU